MTKKQKEMDIAENPLYHDTWKLLKKYRDVVWSLELSVQQVRGRFEIEKRKSSAEEPKTEGTKAKEPKAEGTKAREPKAGRSRAKEPKAKAAKAEAPKAGTPKETDSRTKTPESGQKKEEKKSLAPIAGGQAGIVVTDKESIMS